PRSGDAADVNRARAQRRETIRLLQHCLERPGPAGLLIEEVALGLTAARDEDAVQALRRRRNFIAAFAVAVDLEAHDRFELRQHFSIEVQLEAEARREYVVAASTHAPSGRQFSDRGRDEDGRQSAEHQKESAHHTLPLNPPASSALSRRTCAVALRTESLDAKPRQMRRQIHVRVAAIYESDPRHG